MDITRTGGKINIFLRITGLREDGYHTLQTLFMPIPEPWDELRLSRRQGSGFVVRCLAEGIDPKVNTLTAAYTLYADCTGFAPALTVELIKGIPHGAGLGGGSADAAVLLNWLQRINPAPLGKAEMNRLAAQVGADVPFFLNPVPSLAGGIGDELVPVNPGLEGFWVVLVCPRLKVNTSQAFRAWDKTHNNDVLTLCGKTDKNHRSCLSPEASIAVSSVDNDFEPVIFAMHPELNALKGLLFKNGAAAACMSGSGSALFGLFRERAGAASAVGNLGFESSVREFGVYGPFQFGTSR